MPPPTTSFAAFYKIVRKIDYQLVGRKVDYRSLLDKSG